MSYKRLLIASLILAGFTASFVAGYYTGLTSGYRSHGHSWEQKMFPESQISE